MATPDDIGSSVQFKPFRGSDRHLVGDDGSFWYRRCQRGHYSKWRPMVMSSWRNGYVCVHVAIDGRTLCWSLHRIVLETFVGQRPPGMECRHLDGDKTNNRLSNLCWGTRSQNRDDTRRHCLEKHGGGHYGAKLGDEAVAEAWHLKSLGKSLRVIAQHFSVSESMVSNIFRGKVYKHVKVPD